MLRDVREAVNVIPPGKASLGVTYHLLRCEACVYAAHLEATDAIKSVNSGSGEADVAK